MSIVADYRRKVDRLLADYRYAKQSAKEEAAALKGAKQHLQDVVDAQAIVQKVAEGIQAHVHRQLSGVVSSSLSSVFENPYSFHLRFEQKRSRTEAKLVFERDGIELDDPKNEAGVGSIDIAALALRLSCLMLTKPKPRRLLVGDEIFKNINGTENRARAAALITTLAKDLGFQFVISTGYEWLRIGKVMSLDDG